MWPCNQHTSRIILASCTILDHLQTLLIQALCPHPSGTIISNRHCHTNSYCLFTITFRSTISLHYVRPCITLKLVQRAFCYAIPHGTLPSSLQQMSIMLKLKHHLKPFLFHSFLQFDCLGLCILATFYMFCIPLLTSLCNWVILSLFDWLILGLVHCFIIIIFIIIVILIHAIVVFIFDVLLPVF